MFPNFVHIDTASEKEVEENQLTSSFFN